MCDTSRCLASARASGGLGDVSADAEGDVTRLLHDVLDREAEPPRVPQHRLVRVVDELAAQFGDLAWEKAAQRIAPSADAVGRLIHGRGDSATGKSICARQSGEAGADDADAW
jgi:hypothetical protein